MRINICYFFLFQVALDYILPNVILGIVGVVSKQVLNSKSIKQILIVVLSILVASTLRFLFLTISGVVYWETGFVASVIYNGGYTLFSMIISMILTPILVNRFVVKN